MSLESKLHCRTEWVPPPLAAIIGMREGRITAPQWLIATTVGLAMGLVPLASSAVPERLAPVVILAALFPFVTMICWHVRRVLLALVILDTPLQLGTFNINYQNDLGTLGAFGGLNISLTTVGLTVLYALWLFELLGRVEPRPRPVLGPSLPLVLYIAFAALSCLQASNLALSLDEMALLVQTFLLYIYVVSHVRTPQDVRFIVTLSLIGLILESVIMIALLVTGQILNIPGLSTHIEGDQSNGVSRIGGTIGSDNGAAEYLSLLLAPAASVMLTPFGRRHGWLAILAFGLGGVALVLTYSRGGWLAFAVSMTILCTFAWRRRILSPGRPLAVVAGLALLSLAFGNPIVARLAGNDHGAAAGRVPLNEIAFRIIRSHPFQGVGLNNFAVVMPQYITPDLGHIWIYVVHDKYLLVWAETGLGGLLAFLAFLFTSLYYGWRCWQSNDAELAPIALGFTAAVIGDMAHMLVDVFNGRPATQQLWLIAALLAAMYRISVKGRARRHVMENSSTGASRVSLPPHGRISQVSGSPHPVPTFQGGIA